VPALTGSYLVPIREGRGTEEFGRKAEGLRFLIEMGHRVPPGFVIPNSVRADYQRDSEAALERLRQELVVSLVENERYAVRSSSDLEEGAKRPFAGELRTVLDRSGVDQVLGAVKEVWRSASTEGREENTQGSEGEIEIERVAVIVQKMVPTVFSGLAFSQNPLTEEDEEVVEALSGKGGALVNEGVTPERWVIREGGVLRPPFRPMMEARTAIRIGAEARQIAKQFGHPVVLEWVFDGHQVHWLQLREINALGQVNVYSNTFSKEVLPGLIKPLVWSVNIPLVNGAWVRFLSEMTGVKGLKASDLARQFYYRAYFNVGALGLVWKRMGLPPDSLERLLGAGGQERGFKFSPTPKMLAVTPNLIWFLLRHISLADKMEVFLPRKEEELRALAKEDLGKLSEEELLAKVDELDHKLEDMAYYNVITQLAANLFFRLLESRLRKAGVSTTSLDILQGQEGFRRYYPDQGLRSLRRTFESLDQGTKNKLRDEGVDGLNSLPLDNDFRASFESFIRDFGYVSESGNDFSAKPWREDPGMVLALIADYPETERDKERTRVEDLELRSGRRGVLAAHRKSQRMALIKERTSAAYTFGYGLYRIYFMELARRFVTIGILEDPNDIFYLNLDELRQIIAGGCAGNSCNNYRLRAAIRKREMLELKDIAPPSVIYGDKAPPLMKKAMAELRGTPTSRGYYKGRARLVRSPSEFQKVQKGDVIVIPYSDVAWTPLFAKAGAVVAESGGVLSHSSIVAREYGIPAVVSVEGAMNIPDGAELSVDGYQGVVSLNPGNEANEGGH
jgi:phosphohistidine swiveling domain-containing protein